MSSVPDAIGKLRRMKKSKMPRGLVCVCPLQVVVNGCKCGAAQAEKALKAQKRPPSSNRKDCAAIGHLPVDGEVVVVRRPDGSTIDHGGIPLSIWHTCHGKQFEVLISLWDDKQDGKGLALLDLSAITGKQDNDWWFPLDGLELP